MNDKRETELNRYPAILSELKKELSSSLGYLDYSYKKVQQLSLNLATQDPEDLETLEALVSRFSRTTDIFISKYLRTYALNDDPGFKGTLIDTIQYAEKRGLIESAQTWADIRELRNKIAHEYAASDLHRLFSQVLSLTPVVLALSEKLK